MAIPAAVKLGTPGAVLARVAPGILRLIADRRRRTSDRRKGWPHWRDKFGADRRAFLGRGRRR